MIIFLFRKTMTTFFAGPINQKKANELDEVFTQRQKFGVYEIITPKKKKVLKAEFLKVINQLNRLFIYFFQTIKEPIPKSERNNVIK